MIGYSFDDNYGVKAVTGIDIKGDIIAANWFKFIVNESGKSQTNAILILGKLFYLHRAIREIDSGTHQEQPWRKKFAEEFYRIDYFQFAKFLELTDRQVRDAITVLRKCGVLNLHLVRGHAKDEKDEKGKPTVKHVDGTTVYVEMIVKRLEFITNRPDGVNDDDIKAPFPEGKIFHHNCVESLRSTCNPIPSPTHEKTGVETETKENSDRPANSFNPNSGKLKSPTHEKTGVGVPDSRKNGRHIGTKNSFPKNSKTTRIPPTSLSGPSDGMDGFVVSPSSESSSRDCSNLGTAPATRGALALAPTFEDLPFDSSHVCPSTNAEDSKIVSGENSGDEPSPVKAPNDRGSRIFHQTNHVPTILPAAVQALIEWNLETVACPVSQSEIQKLVELCRDEQYSFAELTACYLAHKAPGSGWKLPSWKTVTHDIPKFAALHRAVATAVVNLPDLPALVTALGSDWNQLPLTVQHNWAVAVQKFGWHLAGVSMFLAYFAHTPKGKKGFLPSVADLRDHWSRALETQALEVELMETQQALVTQLEAAGVNRTEAMAVVLEDETQVAIQLTALPYRDRGGIDNLSGWLLAAIRGKFAIPEAIARLQKQERDRAEAKRRQEQEAAEFEASWQTHKAAYWAYILGCEAILAEQNPTEWAEFRTANPVSTNPDDDTYMRNLMQLSTNPSVALKVLHWLDWRPIVEAGGNPIRYRLKAVPVAPQAPVLALVAEEDWRVRQARARAAYDQYRRECEQQVRASHPDLFQQFLDRCTVERDRIKTFPRIVAAFDEPEGYFERFVRFFANLKISVPVMDMSNWRIANGF